MPKNKTIVIILSVVALIILVGGAFFIFGNKQKAKTASSQTASIDTGPLNLSVSEIDLTLTSSSDKQKVQFAVGKLTGIKAIAYELTYEADSTDQEESEGGTRIQQGVTGDAKFKSGESSYKSPWLDLGTCSKNVCRYDKGVNSVDLILKITKDNNKIYSAEQKLDL